MSRRAKIIVAVAILAAAYYPVLLILEWSLMCDFTWDSCGWFAALANLPTTFIESKIPIFDDWRATLIVINAVLGALIGWLVSYKKNWSVRRAVAISSAIFVAIPAVIFGVWQMFEALK